MVYLCQPKYFFGNWPAVIWGASKNLLYCLWKKADAAEPLAAPIAALEHVGSPVVSHQDICSSCANWNILSVNGPPKIGGGTSKNSY